MAREDFPLASDYTRGAVSVEAGAECDGCRTLPIRCAVFDNSGDEYTPTWLCAECLRRLLAVVEGADPAASALRLLLEGAQADAARLRAEVASLREQLRGAEQALAACIDDRDHPATERHRLLCPDCSTKETP